ncbi:MAG: tetratricopeptide repeat protein [Kangiellaceae bacterium]|nr:tetratricopeptide repeat protein [Kangiellaceae bacterium]
MEQKKGFFSTVLERRIPQIFGIFLAGSWTALEFTQWAVERYSLAPVWEEIILVFLLLCLPLILVLAWHHGAPGKQSWSLFEKIFIPLNLLAVPLALHHLYADQDLGSTVETVMVADEQGVMQERSVAKDAHKKSIAIFPFKNSSGQTDLDPLAIITSEVLRRDLSQNIFYSLMDLANFDDDIRRSTLTATRLPLSFQINTAKKRARDYFVTGSVNTINGKYQITAEIYDANSGKKLAAFEQTKTNYFSAIDNITQGINEHFRATSNSFTDLPIEDLYTNQWQAFIDYSKAVTIEHFSEKRLDAQSYYEKAIELDPTFSQAAFKYSGFLLQGNGLVSAQKYTKLAQQHKDYRLTEREQFAINTIHFFINQKSEEAFKTLDQWSLLYPDDYMSYQMKASFYQVTQKPIKAIENYKKVIELDPSQHVLWDVIGDIYTAIGDYDQAATAYEKYSEKNANNPIAFKNLGDLYSKTGNMDLAISNYQQALSINPNDVNSLRNLANSLARIGEVDKAENMFLQAIEYSSTSDEKLNSKTGLASFYWNYGKVVKSVETYQQAFDEYAETTTPRQGVQGMAIQAWRYHIINQDDKAEEILRAAYKLAEDTNEDIFTINVQVAEALLRNEQGRAAEALPLYENVFKVARAYLQDGNDINIGYYKAQSHLELGQYEQALQGFNAMNDRFPDQIGVQLWIARTHLATKDFTQAEEVLKRILVLAPAYPFYNFYMAKTLIAQNQILEAKEYLNKALSGWNGADYEFEELLEARRLVSSL